MMFHICQSKDIFHKHFISNSSLFKSCEKYVIYTWTRMIKSEIWRYAKLWPDGITKIRCNERNVYNIQLWACKLFLKWASVMDMFLNRFFYHYDQCPRLPIITQRKETADSGNHLGTMTGDKFHGIKWNNNISGTYLYQKTGNLDFHTWLGARTRYNCLYWKTGLYFNCLYLRKWLHTFKSQHNYQPIFLQLTMMHVVLTLFNIGCLNKWADRI